jgi:aspartate aminotransferase
MSKKLLRKMMSSFLSNRIQAIKPSATLAVTQKGNELKEKGLDVISLSAGEPDFDTPRHIKEASYEAIKNGATKYTNVDGISPLKKAIQRKFLSENMLSYELNEILVTPGVKFGLYAALMVSVNPGDEVIIPTPYWPSYLDMTVVAEGKPIEVFCPSFKLTPELLERYITPQTKWLLLNSPSNPSGMVYDKEELEKLAAVLRKYPHVYIMSDEIYEHITFGGTEFYSFAHAAPDLKERTLTLNGVSKAYAMTGWRIGYAAGPAFLIQAMKKLQSQSMSNPATPSQYAALEALQGSQEFLTDFAKIYENRRDLMLEYLNKHPNFKCQKPEGAFYLFPNISALIGKQTPAGTIIKTDVDLSTYFLEQVNIATVPGSAFGQPDHLRLSFATHEDAIQIACNRLILACNQLQDA